MLMHMSNMHPADCEMPSCGMQAAEAETKKYAETQQSEQAAFQASIADLSHAVASMQSYTDMSAATAVADEVCSLASKSYSQHSAPGQNTNPCA